MYFKLFLNLFCLLRSVCALRRQVVIKRDGLTYDVDVDGLPVLSTVFTFDRSLFDLLNFRPETIRPGRILFVLIFRPFSSRLFVLIVYINKDLVFIAK